jgi:hypothetical protein
MLAGIPRSGKDGPRRTITLYRWNFKELTKNGTSPIGLDALRRFARIYAVESELKGLSDQRIAALGNSRAVVFAGQRAAINRS